MWNELAKVIRTHKDEKVRKHAQMLLGQLNTAGGIMIKGEIQNFLDQHSE
jgi:hypothetical protein